MSDSSPVFLNLENLPFCSGVRENFDGVHTPAALPFALGMNPQVGLAIQLPNVQTQKALTEAYLEGSMLSTPLGEGTFGKKRMQLMMAPLLEIMGNFTGKYCLEIGCGTGGPMLELIAKGAHLTGCEVGPQGRVAAKRTGAKVIEKLFHPDLFSSFFDCIYSFGVLEHIPNITRFVCDVVTNVKPGGLFYSALQNAQPHLETGSISLLEHEHWNYFTPDSALRLLRFAGFVDVGFQVIEECGELCFWGRAPDVGVRQLMAPSEQDIVSLHNQMSQYGQKVGKGVEKIRCFFADAKYNGKTIALYAGGAHYLMCAMPSQSLRFIDGDQAKHGKKWTRESCAIEAPETLLETPVDYVLVCSRTYYTEIKKYLVDTLKISSSTKILNVEELIS